MSWFTIKTDVLGQGAPLSVPAGYNAPPTQRSQTAKSSALKGVLVRIEVEI